MTKRIGELQKQLEGMPETISRRRLLGGGRSTFPNPERTPLQQELDQLMGTRKLFQENEAKLRAEREGQSTPRARTNFGFQPPPKDVAFTSAIVRWVNPKTGEEFRAPSGGWTPPSSDWKVAEPTVISQPAQPPNLTVRPDVLPPKAPSAPGVYPPDFMGPLPEGAVHAPRPDAPRGSLPMPAPGTPIAPMPTVPDPFGPPPSTVTPPMPAPTPVSPAPRPTPPVPTPPVTPPVIPAPNVPKPGMPTIPTPAVPTPSLPTFGRTPQFFNPPAAPGAAPGTVPIGQRNPYVIQMGQTALDLLQQSPNLAPKTLGGQQNLGFMTDRLGNVIQTPGMPPPVRTFADGGIASRTAALNAYNLSDEEGEPILTDPVGTASQMLRELNPQTETEYRATPEKVSMKRISKTPMGNASGTAKGMKMELDEISAMKMPKDLKAASGMSRSELEELAREYGLKRAAALDTAKGLMRATFEKPTLEKSSLTKGSLTKRRFEEGGEVKKDEGAEEGSSAPSMSYFGGSRSVPGVPEKENIREETLGMIRRMDDASVMAMANRLSGLPFESPVQARVMLEKMLGPSAVSLGVMGSGKMLPERLTGYSLGARTPLAGGEFRAGVDVPRGVGKPMFNVGYAKEFQEGGEVTGVNRLVDFIAQRLPAESFPTAARTLLESVQGKKEPITETAFSKDELDVLRRLTGSEKGRVSYEDYSRLAEQLRQEGQSGADATPSLFSLGSPLGNVRNTLGRFTYTRDPQGNVVIVDKYDFNPPVSGQTQESRTSDYGVFGPYNMIREYAGQKLPPGKGRDVRINLGSPAQKTNGSTRKN